MSWILLASQPFLQWATVAVTVPSGNFWHSYWTWPSRNSEFSHSKWWIFPQLCYSLPEGTRSCALCVRQTARPCKAFLSTEIRFVSRHYLLASWHGNIFIFIEATTMGKNGQIHTVVGTLECCHGKLGSSLKLQMASTHWESYGIPKGSHLLSWTGWKLHEVDMKNIPHQ